MNQLQEDCKVILSEGSMDSDEERLYKDIAKVVFVHLQTGRFNTLNNSIENIFKKDSYSDIDQSGPLKELKDRMSAASKELSKLKL